MLAKENLKWHFYFFLNNKWSCAPALHYCFIMKGYGLEKRFQENPYPEFNGRADFLNETGKADNHLSFLLGRSGPPTFSAFLLDKRGKDDQLYTYGTTVAELFYKYSKKRLGHSIPDEVLYGRAGYLYSLIYLNRNTNFNVNTKIISDVCATIINSGKHHVDSNYDLPLQYTWHETEYLGAAHGYVGILYMLLDPLVRDLPLIKNSLNVIKLTVDKVFDSLYPSGNLPSSLPQKYDELVQWCHGAPGAIYLAIRYYKFTNDEKYLFIAMRMADVIWERGILLKGPGLCHGISGNAYAFLAIYNCTKDSKYLYYTLMFAKSILQFEPSSITASRQFSLYEGLAGALYFLADLHNPSTAMFPGFQTCVD
ncbi:hypothetical protein HZS_5472 [Henneguya salminicola]|nr:hypothetical protein HZS_5472 [Henneguya salminicola]